MGLDDKIRDAILQWHQRLQNESKLLSDSQLDECYQRFRQRFGIDQLRRLDGQALLETMHAHGNQDSLVYWLEFKNDEEFPAQFGSIAGGSALKFGIYRRADTGVWMTGTSKNQRELTLDEAIVIARKHRDQLAIGVDLLSQLPSNASDAEALYPDSLRAVPPHMGTPLFTLARLPDSAELFKRDIERGG